MRAASAGTREQARRRAIRPARLAGAALLLLVACNRTSAVTGDGGGGGADLLCPSRACVPEGDEDCAACFTRIGTCCYGDPDWGEGPPTHDDLVARCLTNPGCVACCNECKQMTCASMKARGVCPYTP